MAGAASGAGDVHRSLALMWGYEDGGSGSRGQRGPRPRLTLNDIVERAVALADAEGLDAVSMRRLAADLGVGTMSLYRYVPGKEELLDLMLERVNGPGAELLPVDDWRAAMETMGRSLWRLYTDHAWLPFVDQTRPLLGPRAFSALEMALAALAGTGLTGQQKVAVISMIDTFVSAAARQHNSGLRAERESTVSNEEFWAAQEPLLTRAMAGGQYPQLAGLDPDAFGMSGEDFLEFGLRSLLDGVQRLLARIDAGTDKAPVPAPADRP